MSFKHPEWSRSVRGRFAAEFLASHDTDGDGKINATEFLQKELLVKEAGDNPNDVQSYEHRAEAVRCRQFHHVAPRTLARPPSDTERRSLSTDV
jgi:hypothetical protein